jgi:hypothetical protein
MNSPYKPRPRPDDFEEVYRRLGTQVALQKHYGAGTKAIRRWIKGGTGIDQSMINPPPLDFGNMARIMCREELKRHYGRSWQTIGRWFRMSGLTPIKATYKPPHNARPVPNDFRQLAAVMVKTELLAHYKASYETVNRWLNEAGVSAKVWRPQVYIRPTSERSHVPIPSRGLGNDRRPERAYGPEDRAADVLRRYGPVYRCDERGRMDVKGSLWRFGMVICDGKELQARAARKERVA